jgi:UDP-N-acetylglucosamine 2-epimerase (non-hydrolysing)
MGQHVDLLKNIRCDYTLNISESCSNRLNQIFIDILSNSKIFDDIDYVLVQGDTTSAVAMALSAFHHNKKIIHLEAGLRSHDKFDPFPEEMNRQTISRLADIHLCPTIQNKENLLQEKVCKQIFITGNTGLDNISKEGCKYENTVIVTLHRRENHPIMDKWFLEIEKLANIYEDLEFILPIHPNPNVIRFRNLLKKVRVIEPLSHDHMINYLKRCKFVISDSGGLQEECSYLNKKIIVCRKTTERPESLGKHSFLCPYPENLLELATQINSDYVVDLPCPYGNGNSSRIVADILNQLE